MSTQSPIVSSTRGPRLVFLCLTLISAALSIGTRYGVVGATVRLRAVGCVAGLVIIALGFFLQRLPARAAQAGSSTKATGDRLIGWALMLAGLAQLALFSLISPEPARLGSLMIEMTLLVAFATGWSWRLIHTWMSKRSTARATGTPDGTTKRERLFSILLLAAYVYIAATACAAFLFESRIGALALWMTALFWMLYTLGSATLADKYNAIAAGSRA